jgi:predicted Zn-dependent protease
LRIAAALSAALLTLGALAGVLTAAGPAAALTLIRDAEIEATMRRIADPLFRVAAMNPAMVKVYLVQDPAPNAFVAGGQNIFVNTGLLASLEGVDELRSVIAHELGHITGGHLARRDQALGGARGIAAIGMIGAAVAVVGGAPGAGVAIAAGAGQAAQREALAYSRGEESAADQAGLRYLAAAGGQPEAMLAVLGRFRRQDSMSGAFADPYAQSHPMWSERIGLLEEQVAKLPPCHGPREEERYWHARMVAKLAAFLDPPSRTLRAYPAPGDSDAARLARAIALHRTPDPAAARAAIDALIAERPEDAFLLDLEAQFRLEAGDAGAAAGLWRRAIALDPKQPLMLGGLGRALLNTDDPALTGEARDALARSIRLDPANGPVLRDLALAEARLGNEGAAALATADRFLLAGELGDAARNAARAASLLPEGSPGWRKAEDILRLTRKTTTKRGRR